MNGALSTGRMRDFDEIAMTRWRKNETVVVKKSTSKRIMFPPYAACMAPVLDGPAQSYASGLQQLAPSDP
ncbi:hypothetical protein Scep_014877 [Stephania cephalantha]|uniref:Uncharacterized protein n=1 Tax=Stephania cephalantha TaxID=152367 RepID=A0AAP0J4P0_9MAGN